MATNVVLDFAGDSATLPVGPSTLTIDFNGNLIAQSSQNAPYRLRDITVSCGTGDKTFSDWPIVNGFTATQFRNIPKSITVQPASSIFSVPRGGAASMDIKVNGQGGLQQIATLSLASLPASTTAAFAPFADIAMNESRTRTIARGASAAYALSLTMLGGFNSSVVFSATGLPAGTTASFNPTSATTTRTIAATIQTTSSTPRATHSITLRGINGGITKTVTVTLVVN